MAPSGRQRTFELVPNAPILGQHHPGDDAQPIYSKPPMTTKQAKKLHNQKNKGPKLSKAEQRRIELMEQDRIRKEFEKEKAQARARTAREKKKAKEEREKEERKKKGLPLVDIHPSQDTISRFISRVGRVIGVKRDSATANNLDSVKEDMEDATDVGESETDAGDEGENGSDKENQQSVKDPEPGRQIKKRRLSQPDEKAVRRMSPVASQFRAGPVAKVAQQLEVESFSRASSVDTDDPVNQTLLEEQIFADVEQASSRKDRGTNEECPDVAVIGQPLEPISRPIVTILPVSSAPKQPPEICPLPTRLQAPQPSIALVRNDLQLKARATSHAPSHLGNEAFEKPTSPYAPAPRPRTTLTSHASQMTNAPPKFKAPAALSDMSAERPRFLPKHLGTAQRREPSPVSFLPGPAATFNFPTSTQAFLLDHADELFPSPTQEARELLGDSVTESPEPKTNAPRVSIHGPTFRTEAIRDQTSVVAPFTCLGSRLPALAPPVPATEDFFDSSFISTQDFMISTQDILEIETPSKAPPIPAAPLLPMIHKELPAPVRHAKGIEKSAENVSAIPGTVQGRIEQPRNGPVERQTGADSNDAVACCPDKRIAGSRQSQGHQHSCASMRKDSSQRVTQCEHGDHPKAASRPPRSSHQRRTAVGNQRSTQYPNNSNGTAVPAPDAITTPDNPRPKKRMFGSSGPGPEGLVAMERSYQEMRRQERAREAQIRAQESLVQSPAPLVPQIDLDIAGLVDDILEDDFGDSTEHLSSRRPSDNVQQDFVVQPPLVQQNNSVLTASQETDYGDIDGEDFDFLNGDTSWLDEDLDDM